MRKFWIFTLLSIVTLSASADEIVMRAVKSNKEYHSIEVGGPIKVFVEERTDGNIIVRATEKIHSILELKIEDYTLTISFPKGFDIKKKSDFVQAEVYIPNNGKLEEFTVLACGIIDVKPQIRAKEVDIEAVAASQIDIDVVADKLTIDVVGAAKAAVKAECASIEVELTGASTLSLSGKATKGEFDLVGASSLYAESFHCSQLEAECTGASSAEISADMAEVDAAGASTANVVCTTRLDASAAGASTIRYSGDCQVNIKEASGASAIKKK